MPLWPNDTGPHGVVLGHDRIEIEPYGVSVMGMPVWAPRLQGSDAHPWV